MATIISDPNVVTVQNSVERVTVTFTDASGALVDPTSITLNVMDLGATVLLSAIYPVTSPATTRIIKQAIGTYYIDYGNQSPNVETNNPAEVIFQWAGVMTDGTVANTLQKIKVISVRTASLMPDLRQMIDKSHKLVDVANDCFLGYTNGQMLMYLEGGLQNINAYQPSVVFTLDNYPLDYKQLLIDSSLITGVMSQQLYAIDTDIPNYNDQGTSFVISHQPQLASFLNQITQRLDKLIPMMKLQMITSGSVHVAMGPNFRLQTLLSASPSGAIFRGVYFAGN